MATPDEAKLCGWVKINDELTYVSCEEGDEESETPGGSGSSEPPCDLSEAPYTEFCDGANACWGNDPAGNSEEDVADKLPPKPDDPDIHVAYKSCMGPDGGYDEWFWSTGAEPSRRELALEAFGALQIPAFAPTFNPPGRTIVNLETWWSAEGAGNTDIIGTGIVNCDFSAVKSEDCVTVYRRSSDRGRAGRSCCGAPYKA